MLNDNQSNSADALVDVLAREGIEYVFGLPGSQILDVVDGVARREGMSFVSARHEQGAAFMAEGFARATRGPSICLSTVGPGATNLVTSVASAFKGHVPVLALTGKHARWQQERNTFQEIDQKAVFDPVTRYSRLAAEPADLPKLTRRAFRTMAAAPRGPAHLNLPKDTQGPAIDYRSLDPSAYHARGPDEPSDAAVADVVSTIAAADRPVLFAGYDIVWAGATDRLAAFAEGLGAPVVTSCFHPDALPSAHDLSMGPLGPGYWESANSVVGDADCVVAVGAHFDFLSTNFSDRIVPAEATKLQVYHDAGDVGAVYPLDVGLACDVAPFLEKANAHVRAEGVGTDWDASDLTTRKEAWFEERAADIDRECSPVHPATTVRLVREVTPNDAVFTIDGGNFLKHVIRQLDTTAPNTYFSNANFSTVGSALPMAVGVQLAVDTPVVCLVGDGGMALNVQELETAARHDVPLTIVVFNDYGLGNVRSYQQYVYEGRFAGVDYGDQDFATVAEGFGVEGQRVDTAEGARAAIEQGLDADAPFVVDVETDAGALEQPVFMQNDE
jgi:thiamine pyrophosphate-dependent acetolactate synthase large subunit-like protein